MKPESIFQKRVLRDLKSLPNCWVLKTQEKTRRGVPDILACYMGKFIALELKASEKSPIAPLQEFELGCINHAMGHAYIAYPENWIEVLNIIKNS